MFTSLQKVLLQTFVYYCGIIVTSVQVGSFGEVSYRGASAPEPPRQPSHPTTRTRKYRQLHDAICPPLLNQFWMRLRQSTPLLKEINSRTRRLRKYLMLTEQLCRGGITTNNNQSRMPTRNRCFLTYKKRKGSWSIYKDYMVRGLLLQVA